MNKISMNLFILGVYAKRWPKCALISNEDEDHSIGKILSEKKYGGTGLVSEKTEVLYAKLN